MNKKFLSVILSASMVLSPFGGKYCFAQTVAEPATVENEARFTDFNAAPRAQLRRSWVSAPTSKEQQIFTFCVPRLQHCANENMKLRKVLLLNNENFDETVSILNKYQFSVPNDAFFNATTCLSALTACVIHTESVCARLSLNSIPYEQTPFLDEEQNHSGKHSLKGWLAVLLGALLTRQLINKCFNK